MFMVNFVTNIILRFTMETVLEFIIFLGFLYWAFPNLFTQGVSSGPNAADASFGMYLNSLFFVNLAFVALVALAKFDVFDTLYGSFQLFLVLQFTYLILFLKGVNKMVDVVTNRMFDTFNRFSPREGVQNDSISTLTTLKRFTRDQKFRKALSREADAKAREQQLYDIKENVPEVQLPKKRPFSGLSCQNCTLTSRESLVSKATERYSIKNILDYQIPSNCNGFIQRTFSHLYQVYELKKFNYPQVAPIVLKDDRLKRAIETTALQQFKDSDRSDDEFYQELVKNNKKRASKILYDMRSTLSDFLLRFTSWVLYKLLPCFVTSIAVNPGQVEMLKKAAETNLPLIFLPLHRSHLDYILMSFILLNNNVRSPLVAAGDNLRIPFFGSLLRGLGAFFIKRRIDPIMGRKDHVYKAVLHTYMNECLRAGHNIEFFLEGGRTRTGKPCMPKYGVLSVIVDSFMDGTIEDALLVPVSMNYERLVDGNFVREQLGQPKEMETFGNAMAGIWSVLNSNYGMMRVDFNQPFSLRELVKTFDMTGKIPPNGVKKLKSNPSTTSLFGTDVVAEEHKALVENISKHIIYDCAKSTSVMSTNALAFLLLNKHRKGATVEELVNSLNQLRSELELAGKDVGFTGDSIDVINYAVDIMGPGLVKKEKVNNEDVIRPVAILPNVIELSYYSNTLATHYALESIIAIALSSIETSSGKVGLRELVDASLELTTIFSYEFIFNKPCQNLEQLIMSTIDDLVIQKQIFITEEESQLSLKSRRIAQQFDDDSDDDQELSKLFTINKSEAVVNYLEYLRGILMPLVEAYVVTAFTLDKLVGRQLLENELVKEVLDEMKGQLSIGSLQYEESVSVDPVKNALKLYQKWEILECHSENKLRIYYLREGQDNAEAVRQLHQRIRKFQQSRVY